MQGYHRQKRQKEVQKNKDQRIKARDAKVVQTKTVAEVQEEIRNIKRRKNLQHSEQQKLQRLEKELKLVTEAAAAKPKEPTHLQQLEVRPLTELDDPRKSVYYDEKMNPYGAPPPGKPRLYHQRGGGVTMDIRFAIVPGEEPVRPPPPPPPPPPPARLPPGRAHGDVNRGPRDIPGNRHRTTTGTGNSNTHRQIPSRASPQDVSSQEKTSTQNEKADENVPKVPQRLVAPSLPAPSKAVQRTRKGTPLVDVWASTEEVEYERVSNQVDLEADDVGTRAAKKMKPKTRKPPLEIYYQDRAGQIQGPFPKAQMAAWVSGGFFPADTMVKTNRNETWIPIGDLPALQDTDPKPNEKDLVQDRIAALKNSTSSVEDRIAALKAQSRPSYGDDDDKSIEDPQASRVDLPEPYIVDDNEIAYPSVNSESPPPYPIDDDYDDDDGVPPPSEDDEGGDDRIAVSQYPGKGDELPAYPIDEDVDYPVDTTYPSEEGDDDLPLYPVTEAYGAVDEYPVDEDDDIDPSSRHTEDEPVAPILPMPVRPKKVVKVDKALLTFTPSNLQNRKRKMISGQTVATLRGKKVKLNPHNSVAKDDMDRYMEEIEALDS